MDWDVLQAHETGIAPRRHRAGEEPLEGAHIVNVDIVAFEQLPFQLQASAW